VSLHRQVQKEQVTVVTLEGSHILNFAVVIGFHQLTVQLIDQRASLKSIDKFLGLPVGLDELYYLNYFILFIYSRLKLYYLLVMSQNDFLYLGFYFCQSVLILSLGH
jgi:hypothetical protein